MHRRTVERQVRACVRGDTGQPGQNALPGRGDLIQAVHINDQGSEISRHYFEPARKRGSLFTERQGAGELDIRNAGFEVSQDANIELANPLTGEWN
jgi:hypothetical protein